MPAFCFKIINMRTMFFLLALLGLFGSCGREYPTTPSSGSMLKLYGDNQTGAPGDTLSVPLVVIVADIHASIIPYQWVEFNVIEGDAHVSDESALTDYNGRAGVLLILGETPGVVKVEAKLRYTSIRTIFSAMAVEVKSPRRKISLTY